MAQSAILGYPRIGANRELKRATEAYWGGKISIDELTKAAKDLRAEHWKFLIGQGLDIIPSNDFSFYDHVLDHSCLFNVIPKKYADAGLSPLDTMFAMARGRQKDKSTEQQMGKSDDLPALEMVKWFDSNYHYVRPEISSKTKFELKLGVYENDPVKMFLEAKETFGINTRPVLIGPVSFLYLAKSTDETEPISRLPDLLPVYVTLLKKLKEAGAEWVQIDEPILVYDLPKAFQNYFETAYKALAETNLKIMLTTYFGEIGANLPYIKDLPVDGLHIDLVRGREQFNTIVDVAKERNSGKSEFFLSLGLVDGRNIWKTNFAKALEIIKTAAVKIPKDKLVIATSSSLLHTPHTIKNETKLDPVTMSWLAFANEKVAEVVTLTKAFNNGTDPVKAEWEQNAKYLKARSESQITSNPAVRERMEKVTSKDMERKGSFEVRSQAQQKKLNLPLFPTTTIGSFPQTKEIRQARAKFTKGELTTEQFEKFLEKEIAESVRIQEERGLDVLVHGEPERNDMVQYFGEQLDGFKFTTNGWVQSYGSRYVRPPIVIGDVSRPAAMTVKWSSYAQSLTTKPVKGMLTGPVTMLRWSFPRDDISQAEQFKQIALAMRDEVIDLEKAGVSVIQVDEPALREGLPFRKEKRNEYLNSAVDSFKLATSGVEDETQIHSHFCYSDFNDIFPWIKKLDADVISIEAAKSDFKLGNAIDKDGYTSCIGPGVYDVHSPRVPRQDEIETSLRVMLGIIKPEQPKEGLGIIKPEQLWVNPDCGLKTRAWPETEASLANMVEAAKELRKEYKYDSKRDQYILQSETATADANRPTR